MKDMFTTTKRLREFFESVADLDESARQIVLDRLRASPDERSAIAAMIEADRCARSFFDVCAADRITELTEDPLDPAALVGATMGPFRLVELVGQGGSSVVFRATRPIGDGSQEVALKILHAGLFSADSRRRFRREQRVLVELSHPHIARLIDAGVNQMGVPYIAMEFVRGSDLLSFAAQAGLDRVARLELFVSVCRAVDAAHRALIVHRDLKPSNVLVGRDGMAKILDFGIAKLTATDAASTDTREPALTPAYAAPEQFENGVATAAMDVYALGVIAGELLLGKRLGPGARLRGESAVSVPAAQARADGDLQLLLSTALAASPDDRYASAGRLADDVERYLRRQPLLAHRPSAVYRTRKFIVRHRKAAVALATFALAVAALSSIALREAYRATRDELQARSELDRANSMRDFMFYMLSDSEYAELEDARNAGDAADRVSNAVLAAANADPRSRVEVLTHLASVLNARGKLDRSRELLASVVAEADAKFGEDDPLSIAAHRISVSNVLLRGDPETARNLLDALLAKHTGGELGVRLLIDSANLAARERAGARALRESADALALARRFDKPDLLRAALSSRGTALVKFGDDDLALGVYTELLHRSTALGERNAVATEAQLGMARAYRHKGDLDKAAASAENALALDRSLYPGDHPRLAADLAEAGNIANEQRRFGQALEYRREVVRMSRALYGNDHPNVAAALATLGESLSATESYAAAIEAYDESRALFVRRFGTAHWCSATVQSNLGFVLARSGRAREGVDELDQSIDRIRKLDEPAYGLLARAYELRALVSLEARRADDALAFISMAREALAAESAPYWDWDGRLDTLQAHALIALRKPAEAMRLLDVAQASLAASAHPDPVVRTSNVLLRATAAGMLGRTATAERYRAEGRRALAELRNPPSALLRMANSVPE